jgi:hypothetical protein
MMRNVRDLALVVFFVSVGGSGSLMAQALAPQPPPQQQPQPAAPIPGVAIPGLGAPLAPTTSPDAGGKIAFANPIHDFGRVKAGEIVKHEFVFTNIGTTTLEVTHVQPTCGCTAAGEWTRKVEPGQTGKIPIQFNSTSFFGGVHKSVGVNCSDRSQPQLALQLKANIWRPIDVQPMFAMLTIPADGGNGLAVVTITNNMEEPLEVFAPEANNPAFKVELKTNTPGRQYQVSITTVPPLPPGNAQGLVSLKTSTTNNPVIHITAWANVLPAMLVMPPTLSLPPAPLAAPAAPTITIQNNSTNGLLLTEPSINVPDVAIKLNEVQPGRVFNVTLSFPQGFTMPPGEPVALTLKSSNPRMPTVNVPIMQQPKPFVPQAGPSAVPRPAAPVSSAGHS